VAVISAALSPAKAVSPALTAAAKVAAPAAAAVQVWQAVVAAFSARAARGILAAVAVVVHFQTSWVA
jgi:hypothetical protein